MAIYEFGPFVLNPRERRLTSHGKGVALPPRILETLIVLVEAGGQTVDKETFFAKLWPDTVVEERNLTVNISTLRAALADGSDEEFIETIPRVGYRFRGSIRMLPDREPAFEVAESPPVSASDPAPISAPRSRAWLWASAVMLLAAITGIGLSLWRPREVSSRTGTTLAVVPFQLVGVSDAEQYLGIGMADAVITQLAGTAGLNVRPTTSVIAYTQSDQDLRAIGRALEVEHVLSGLVQRFGDRIRVTVQLVAVDDGVQQWSDRVDARADDLLALQDLVSQRVAGALIQRAGSAGIRSVPQTRPDAYRLYLEGRFHLAKMLRPNLERSVDLFERALSIDDRFAPAHAALGLAHRMLGSGLVGPPTSDGYALARAEAEKAIALDPSLGDAYMVLGSVKYAGDWDWPGARAALKRAVELGPASAEGRRAYGVFLVTQGEIAQGLSELQQARQLDPTSIIVAENLAIALDYSGRSEEALQQLAAASEIEPSGTRPHYRRLMILDRLRRDDDAIKARLEMARLTDRVAEAEGLSRLFTTAGYDAVLDHVMRLHGERGEHMQGAFAAMALKRQDAALTFLEACVRSRDRVVPFIKVDPAFAPLTGHPRFVKILRQAGL